MKFFCFFKLFNLYKNLFLHILFNSYEKIKDFNITFLNIISKSLWKTLIRKSNINSTSIELIFNFTKKF